MAYERRGNPEGLRRISLLVTAQTAWHLEQLTKEENYKIPGRVVDRLVKQEMRRRRCARRQEAKSYDE